MELNLLPSSPCLPGSSALTLKFPSRSCTGVACPVPMHHLISPFFPLSELPHLNHLNLSELDKLL